MKPFEWLMQSKYNETKNVSFQTHTKGRSNEVSETVPDYTATDTILLYDLSPTCASLSIGNPLTGLCDEQHFAANGIITFV